MKHKPSDNIKNFYQPNPHEHLFRSQSTPSLKRIWQCQLCGLENNSVTWHCLNCECVSFLAPIYKETLKKNTSIDLCAGGGGVEVSSNNLTATTDGNVDQTRQQQQQQQSEVHSQSMDSDCGPQRKCQLCMYKTMGGDVKSTYVSSTAAAAAAQMCRHQHHNKTKFIRFPLIGSTKIGPEQKSFDDAKYYAREGLYYSNRKINKSLSSINDYYGPTPVTGNFFGERILSSPKNRPTTLIVNEAANVSANSAAAHIGGAMKRSPGASSASDSYSRQLSVPSTTAEYSHFDDFAVGVSPHQRRSSTRMHAAIASSILCTICGVCNQTRCMSSNMGSSSGGGSSTNDTSRFTITTLSRSESMTGRNKNSTMPKNGGVFVAVKDWSVDAPAPMAETPTVLRYGGASANIGGGSGGDGRVGATTTVVMQDNYYEILKNPNNNPPYENQAIIQAKEKEHVKVIATKAGQQHMYENQLIRTESHQQQQQQANEPIYAIVNKMNKSKHKQSDTAKYTFIGLTPSGKFGGQNKVAPTNESAKNSTPIEALYASIGPNNNNGSPQQQQQQQRFPVIDNASNMKTSHVTITSSGDHPSATDTSEIYAKVWKGPRKSLDSQKMYVNRIFIFHIQLYSLFIRSFFVVVNVDVLIEMHLNFTFLSFRKNVHLVILFILSFREIVSFRLITVSNYYIVYIAPIFKIACLFI